MDSPAHHTETSPLTSLSGMQRMEWIWWRYCHLMLSLTFLCSYYSSLCVMHCICLFFLRPWALASSPCWDGAMEASLLWLQLPETPTWSTGWLFGDPTPSSPSRTSSFTMVLLFDKSQRAVFDDDDIIFVICLFFVFHGTIQPSVTSPGGVRGWGSPWRRCTEQRCSLQPGRAGWTGSHSLLKDQKVQSECWFTLITQENQQHSQLKETRDEGKCFAVIMKFL